MDLQEMVRIFLTAWQPLRRCVDTMCRCAQLYQINPDRRRNCESISWAGAAASGLPADCS